MIIVQAEQEKSNEFFDAPKLEVPASSFRVYEAGELARTPNADPSPPTRLTSLRSTTNQSQPKPAAQVGFFNIEWHQLGNPDELVVLPVCSTCSEPIVDLSMGLAVADFSVEQSFQPAGEIEGRPLKKVPGSLYYFHKGVCDTVHGIYSIELDKIFKLDQRHDSQAQQESDNE